MATILGSLTLSPYSNIRMALSQPPPASATSSRHSLPECTGLKIRLPSRRPFASLSSKSPRVFRRPRGIVCESAETALDVPSVNDTTWQSLVLKADGPVLVEFWASWCGPCRMIHPVVGELSKQSTGKFECIKLNADDSPSIANQYGTWGIPTIMIFVNGEKKDAVIGAVPKTTLTATIEKFL